MNETVKIEAKISPVYKFYMKYKGRVFIRKSGNRYNWSEYLIFVKNKTFPELIHKSVHQLSETHIERIMNIAATLIKKQDIKMVDKPGFLNGVWQNNPISEN